MNRWIGGALVLLAACSDSSGPSSPPGSQIMLSGRLERSALLADTVRIRGVVIPDSAIVWTVAPAGAATFPAPGQIRFADTGTIALVARADTDSVFRLVHVAAPPTVYFDLIVARTVTLDSVQDTVRSHAIYRAALDGLDTARLTLDTADNTQPTATASGAMVFVSRRDGNGELYAASTTPGAAVTRLTTTAGDEAAPRISKNGASLAYTILIGGIPRLYLAAANLSDTVQVTVNFESSGAVDASPTWSPDGSMLAFMSTTAGPARLYRLHLNGGVFDTLPGAADSGADVEPAWSPDGGRIAFASSRDGPTEIYLLTLSTGAVTRLTTAGGSNGRPAWTADGRIVYVAFVSGHPQLRWLDPAEPAVIHDIPVGTDADHPTSPW